MEVLPLNGEIILGPHLLDVDESALPLAEQQVLQGGNREKGVFREHLKVADES
jgi:hypothetical protein